jgi:hypothetical protein
VNDTPSQATPVSQIEAMYAIESMGRDRELAQLLETELPLLREKLIREHPLESISFEQQMIRRGQDYALQLEVARQGRQDRLEIALNVSASAFMVEYKGKNYSLITAKSICNLIDQLLNQDKPMQPPSSAMGVRLENKNQLST